MNVLLLIAIGGAAGSVLRYLAGGLVQRVAHGPFPTGTLFVNVTGCFAIGLITVLATRQGSFFAREDYRLAVVVGVLGGYTTFSAFGRETIALLEDNRVALAAVNILLSNAAGLLAVWLGCRLARRFLAG